jgi:glycosyltransferase involved in cell wall biosynthesis
MIRISFVVIAYNEARVIEQTLRGIIAQDGLPAYEIVVVNDGSRDRTLQVVQKLAKQYPVIRVVDQPNGGRGAARAAGVQAAKGSYLAFVDADILLPRDWFTRAMHYIGEYDAAGGIAVPDGDATFVYRLCKLTPKVAAQTTTITGNNGLFKRSVFQKVSYNPTKKNGEDVALGYAMDKAGLKTITIADLIVDHREHKSYRKSLAWLFETGQGASRQFYEHRHLRIPDLATFGFVGLVVAAALAITAFSSPWYLALLAMFLYVSAGSFMHLVGKFELLRTPFRSAAALMVNDTLMVAYYLGRIVGFAREWRNV